MGYNIGPTIAVKGDKEYSNALKGIKDSMRLVASEGHAEDVAFWREAQLHPAEAVADAEHEASVDGGDEAQDAPRRKRRRRRRNGSAPQAPA